MFTSEVQERAHSGSREALREIYGEYSREIYAYVHSAVEDEDKAKASVKQIFLNLFRELMKAEEDIDIAQRLTELTNAEINIARVAGGDLSGNAVKSSCTVAGGSDEKETPEEETVSRVRSHIEEEAEEDEDYDYDEDDDEDEDEDDPIFDEPIKKSKTAQANRQRKRSAVEAKEKGGVGTVLAVILLVVLVAIFLWLVAGILMDYNIIPFRDLGYSWFNRTVFELFRLPAGLTA